ncbi:MAG: N-6 DNA methylase [Candidatus Baltobacteraceae bacterium]
MSTKTTASDQVRDAIKALPSSAFSASELAARIPDVSRELFDQVLSRMVQSGEIHRLQRGFYQRSDAASATDDAGGDANPRAASPAVSTPAATAGTQDAPNIANLIWATADEVLRGDYRPHEYGSVILPFTVMRRIDCVLAPTKAKVLQTAVKYAKSGIDPSVFFERATGGLKFWNTSKFDFPTLVNDAAGIQKNLLDFVGGFSSSIRDIFDYYKIVDLINDLKRKNLLFLLVQKFAKVNLHPNVVSNADMGQAFEELIRRFSEQSNETAGEHYTPRDAIRLAVELLFATDEDPTLRKEQRIVTLYDPTAGTGGMLSVAEDHLKEYNNSIIVRPYGQELNEQTYAICKADMLIKGQDISKIVLGNTLSKDAFPNEKFDYMLSNPPYGVDWKKVKDEVEAEARKLGMKGRFGPGLPRISDGQMLFLLHLISKMHPKGGNETSRIAIVMNGSPLFSGGAGSGESEIRRFVLENDLLEAIVALPTEMFYNTGIATYIWILSNKKEPRRVGKVHLVNGSEFFSKMRRSLGNKRREFRAEDIARIAIEYGTFKESEYSKILPTTAFGYNTIVVERPLRLNFEVSPERLARLDDEAALTKNGLNLEDLKEALRGIGPKVFMSRPKFLKALDAALDRANITLKEPQRKAVVSALSERDESADICLDAKRRPEPDSELRDTENVPLGEDIHAYVELEVLPFVPDAWMDESKTKIGYEIPFTRYFYKHVPPRPLTEIDSDLATVTTEIVNMLDGVEI